MNLAGYLKFGGTEIGNDLRALAYVREACLPGFSAPASCECEVYDDIYEGPAADPAPWYVATDSRSSEFLGFIPQKIRLLTPFSRGVTQRAGVGASLGPLVHGHRVVAVEGALIASTCAGMSYGERWLDEMLRGQLCGSCGGDDLCVAVHCGETGMRMLRDVGLVEGPVVVEYGDPDCTMQKVSFELASEWPYLFADPTTLEDAEAVTTAAPLTTLATADEFLADEALVITLEAPSGADATGLRVAIRVALEGTCPDLRVAPCFDVAIATLPQGGVLTIDATRQRVSWRDPVTLAERSGMFLLEFDGEFDYPVVPPCTTVCVSVSNAGAGSVATTIVSYPREI